MSLRYKKLLIISSFSVFLIGFIFLSVSIVWAGSLTPLSAPASTSYTLTDIYNRLNTNATAVAGDHLFVPTGAPASSFYTLTEIYDKIPTINPSQVFVGTSYLGVTGVLNLACATTTFDGVSNLVSMAYDGTGNGTNRWCVTDSGDAVATDILAGKLAWVDGVAITGTIPLKSGDTAVASSSAQSTSLVLTVPQGYYNGVSSTTVSTSSVNFTASNIKSGIEIFGLVGTLPAYTYGDTRVGYVLTTATASGTALANLWNGSRTDGGFDGGSQALGGVDDYNNAKVPDSGRYVGPAGWTACNSDPYDATSNPGGNYCNTGAAGADARDNSTGLVYSLPCNGNSCASFSDASPITYTWTASTTLPQSATLSASELCTAGGHGQAGWSLPTQKQLMQAYIDGSYGNLESSGLYRIYWSATTVSGNPTNAWFTNLSHGSTNNYVKIANQSYVRCVRSAP